MDPDGSWPDRPHERQLVATYRLQLTPDFTLDDAAAVVPYLARLGVSHVYTSSYLQARPGSTHGYDIVDHHRVNDELGGEPALRRFVDALTAHGLGHVLDVVPNHMAIDDARNRLWWTMLRDGEHSAAADFFDIDWHRPDPIGHGRVVLPVLGDPYGDELAAGTLTVESSGDEIQVRYHDHRFPVTDGSATPTVLAAAIAGDSDAIHELLEAQHYRLASWRIGRDELDYRRFFDIDTLAALRVERPEVFAHVHERILEWVRAGWIDGLRIDHIDGLADPAAYLAHLAAAAPGAWIVVEKILEAGEALPASWPVDGTTGYDAMRQLSALHVDPAGVATLRKLYGEITGDVSSFEETVAECKALVVRDVLSADVTRLCEAFAGVFEADLSMRDISRRDQRAAIEAVLVAMPVYRTYAVPGGELSEADHDVLDHAAELALQDATVAQLDERVVPFVVDVLRGATSPDDPVIADVIRRFQQVSGPAMAKGVEDTAMYRWHPLVALNEVGGQPQQPSATAADHVAWLADAAAHRPRSMVATSTHDTKRSEDVRIRQALLSQDAERWATTMRTWHERHVPHWNGSTDPAIAHLVFQTMVGAHPITRKRLESFVVKAVREAKVHTSWVAPHEDYEAAVLRFVRDLYDDEGFIEQLDADAGSLDQAGRAASLVQLVLKVLHPGVPDFYQGTELWTDDLVDPDNRRPVDFAERDSMLAEVRNEVPDWRGDVDGRSKLWLTHRLLAVRRSLGRLLTEPSTVIALPMAGACDGAVAYAIGDRLVVVATVRSVAWCRDGWVDTVLTLPAGTFRDALDPSTPLVGRVVLTEHAGDRPFAVLVRDDGDDR